MIEIFHAREQGLFVNSPIIPQRKEWLPIALGVASLAGSLFSSIFGGASARKQQEAAEKAQQEAQRKAEAEQKRKEASDAARYRYLRNISEVDTARGQNLIRIAREQAAENWQKAQGAAAFGGGTDAAVALEKEKGNKFMADAISTIAAGDTARQDMAEQMMSAADDQNSRNRVALIQQDGQQRMALAQQKAQNTQNFAAGISNAFAQAGALAMSAAQGAKAAKATTQTPTVTDTTATQGKFDANNPVGKQLLDMNNSTPQVKSFNQTVSSVKPQAVSPVSTTVSKTPMLTNTPSASDRLMQQLSGKSSDYVSSFAKTASQTKLPPSSYKNILKR